jgi:hypothetical protein
MSGLRRYFTGAACPHGHVCERLVSTGFVLSAIGRRARVALREGLNNYVGDNGSSFGPYQLHMGGLAPGRNSGPGLGDVFKKETGLDPRNPAPPDAPPTFLAPWKSPHPCFAV